MIAMVDTGQAVEVSSQHHYAIFILFVVGYILHAGLQVDAAARAKNNPSNSRIEIISHNVIPLLARFFISMMAFLGVWKNPALIGTAVSYIPGLTLSAGVMAFLTLPIVPWVAGMFGFFADSALAYIPGLKNAIPPIEGIPQALNTASDEAQQAAVHAAKAVDAVEIAKSQPALSTEQTPAIPPAETK